MATAGDGTTHPMRHTAHGGTTMLTKSSDLGANAFFRLESCTSSTSTGTVPRGTRLPLGTVYYFKFRYFHHTDPTYKLEAGVDD